MAGGLTVSVRQVASYPAAAPLAPGDLLLLQAGGMGGPYATVTAATLVSSALAGTTTPLDAPILDTSQINLPSGAPLSWSGAVLSYGLPSGLSFTVGPSTTPALTLSPAGDLRLPSGTLTVARDPGSAFDVVTLGFMGRSTVASFNNRKGVVTLSAADIYGALGICPPDTIATQCSVDAAICAAINDLLRTYPAVWSWMGRVGDVFLTVADINWALANAPPGSPPLQVPTPPPAATDSEAVNAEWVITYVTGVLAGPPAYATQDWVNQQLAALNTGVTSFNNRQGAVTLLLADVTGVGGAPNNSPNLTGVPYAPTAAPGTSDGQIATTAFVMAAVTAATVGVASFNTRTGAVVLEAIDINDAGGALIASPNFTGTPSAPTPPTGDSSQRLATTAFVMAEVAAATAGVASWNGRTGIVTLSLADIQAAGGAPISSPGFSGIPTAPTAANGTNTTQLATTAFVQNELTAISAGVVTWNGRSGNVTFTQNDLSAIGGLYNPSPALTGTPSAPTQAPNDNSTAIATTAYVRTAIQGAAVTSFNGRSGTVTLNSSDITTAGGALIASPSFTGLPTAPTAAPGNSSTLIATTAFVAAALTSYLPLGGGVLAGPLTLAGNAAQPLQPVPLQQLNSTLAGYAPLASPALTGVPTAPTPTIPVSNAQQIATAGFVTGQLAGYLPLTGGSLSGNLSAPGLFVANPAGGASFGLEVIGGQNILAWGSPNVWLSFLPASNSWFWVSAGTTVAGLDIFGNYSANGSGLFNGGFVRSAGTVTPGFAAVSTQSGGVGVGLWQINQSGIYGLGLGRSDINGNVSGLLAFWNTNDGGLTQYGSYAGKPGGGSWADTSDARIKTVSGDYTKSLASIMQLQPKEWTFLGNDTLSAPRGEAAPYTESGHYRYAEAKTQFTGLVADDVAAVFPECVSEIAGYINGAAVSDLKQLDTSVLVYALINAVKQLGVRVQALDGKEPT